MAIYMQIEGIKGTVTEKEHKDWIEINSFNVGVGRGVYTEPGKVGDRSNVRPSFSDISISKDLDSASPKVFSWCAMGDGKKVLIHFCNDKGKAYLEWTLQSVIPSNYSIGSGGGKPGENINLNYTLIEMKYIPYDKKGSAGSPIPVAYDLETAKGQG